MLPLFGVKFTVADGSDQRVDVIVGGEFGDHERGLSAMGTDHPNVCYHPKLVWTSRLGHTYHHRSPSIIEPLPDPIPRDQPPYPLMIHPDDGWEDSQLWEAPPLDPEPDPPPEPDPHGDVLPF